MAQRFGVRLGAIGGVPLRLTAGWALIAAAMTFVFTPIVQARLDLPTVAAIAVALAVPVLLALSVLIHEIAHGVTAQRSGYRVREYVITLWGGHTTFTSEIDRPGPAAKVAVAGPVTNLVLAALGWWLAPHLGPVGSFLALTLALTNLFVGVFNLLPASPLDGGKLLEAAVWRVTGDRWLGMRVAGRLGQVTAIAVIVGFVALPYLGGRDSTFTTITGIIVGMVIWQGAHQTVKAAAARARAEKVDLVPFLTPAQVVSPQDSVAAIHTLPAFVHDTQRLRLVDPSAYGAVPPERRPHTPASAVARTDLVWVITTTAGAAAMGEIARGLAAGARIFAHHGPQAPGGAVSILDIDRVLAQLKAPGP